MSFCHIKSHKKSFSLPEISVVIAVLSFLIFTSVKSLKNVFNQTQANVDAEKIKIVKQALQTYFDTHGHLPAPADYTLTNNDVNYGKSKTAKNDYDGNLDSELFFTSSDKDILPTEYQEVEYIEATGTQYIDTGISFNSYNNKGTSIILDEVIQYVANSDTEYSLDGLYDKSGTFQFGMKNWHWSWWIRGSTTFQSDVSIGNYKYHIIVNSQTMTYSVNGVTYSLGTATNDLYGDGTETFFLFAKNDCDNKIQFYSKKRIFSYKIYGSNSLLRDFVPCYRKSDNVIGLYDRVSKTFFTNKGSGVFLKGSNVNFSTSNIDYTIYRGIVPFRELGFAEEDVIDSKGNFFEYYVPEIMTMHQMGTITTKTNHQLIKNGYAIKKLNSDALYSKYPCPAKKGGIPSGTCTITTADLQGVEFLSTEEHDNSTIPSIYQEVEYIESTGTQYIDLNVKANSTTIITTDIQYSHINNNFNGYFYNNNNRLDFGIWQNKWYFFYGTTNACPDDSYKTQSNFDADTNRHNIIYSIPNRTIQIDQTIVQPKATCTLQTLDGYNLYLFDRNVNSAKISAKLYSFQMTQNNSIVRNLVPCYRKSDGVAGLYDRVSGTFFTNKGSGSFLIGRELNTPTTRKIYYNQPPYGLRVKDVKSNNEIEPNGSVAYVLLAHGEDGEKTCALKKPTKNGQAPVVVNTLENTSKINSTNKFEAQNCFNAVKQDTYNLVSRSDFLTGTNKEYMFYKGASNANFDDIVEYGTIAELIKGGAGVNY